MSVEDDAMAAYVARADADRVALAAQLASEVAAAAAIITAINATIAAQMAANAALHDIWETRLAALQVTDDRVAST